MSIRSRYNQYRGINAHLHSALQKGGDWESFHSIYIVALRRIIDELLPANYFAIGEKSLQLRQLSHAPNFWRLKIRKAWLIKVLRGSEFAISVQFFYRDFRSVA